MNPPIDPSHHTRPLDTERLDYTRGISSKLRYVEWLSIIYRSADAPVVQQDKFVARRESINERRIPVSARRRETIQQHKRPALPDTAINNSSAINRDHR
jgi:hypothetical protein